MGAGARQLYTRVNFVNTFLLNFLFWLRRRTTRTCIPWCCLHLVKLRISFNPKTNFTLSNSNTWAPTDVISSFTLSKQSHVIIMYQFSGFSGNNYIVMCLSIDSVPQKHTVSLTGNTYCAGNFGLWQRLLNSGAHKVSLDYSTPAKMVNSVAAEIQWRRWNKWQNRAMTIMYC